MLMGFNANTFRGVALMSIRDLMMAFGFNLGSLGDAASALHAMVFEKFRRCHSQGAPSRCVEGGGHLLPPRVLVTEERCTFLSTMTFLEMGLRRHLIFCMKRCGYRIKRWSFSEADQLYGS
jgi:hypothetical protein